MMTSQRYSKPAHQQPFGGIGEPTIVADEQFIERQRLFEDFLSSDRQYGGGDRDYREMIRTMLRDGKRRLIINLNDLRQTNANLATGLLQSPLEWIPPLEVALREVATNLHDPSSNNTTSPWDPNQRLHAGFTGSFGALHTTPRHLSARLLGRLVCLDGIVTSCSLVRPKLLRSVHYHSHRRMFLMREYHDATMLDTSGAGAAGAFNSGAFGSNLNYPTTIAGEESPLVSEFGLGQYRDYQTVAMQEMPERAPAGQLPRTVDVILDDDLVDVVKPGDRVRIIGVYKSLTNPSGSTVPGYFRAAVIALNVRALMAGQVDANSPTALDSRSMNMFNDDDLHNIRLVARRRDIFDLLARSLAPSIYGHEWIKRAVLLQLVGGLEKNLPNGTHLRGDINLMLVGDPSTAKSQMLRFVLAVAPLAIATTGRGSSGVGLTAAVTTDRETSERRLEAGAMVLADRGIVCIDEFDKMSDADRVAIHEVMEQQTVTIAKAGIHTSLNARCSVLAAANPIWGQYRETASPQENIRLPDSLLSRFDLLFIVLDKAEPQSDGRISEHVLRMHRYLPPGIVEGQPIDEKAFDLANGSDDEDGYEGGDEGRGVPGHDAVFQRHYARAPRRKTEAGTIEEEEEEEEEDNDDGDEILTITFLKKYLQYARNNMRPVLTKAAMDHIVTAYVDFRQHRSNTKSDDSTGKQVQTFPVTPRTLETLIRLATAHAKVRLSTRVDKRDAKIAQQLVEYCLYKEVKKKRKPGKRGKLQPSESESSDGEDERDAEETPSQKAPSKDEKSVGRPGDELHLYGLSLEEVASHSSAIMSSQLQPAAELADTTEATGTFVSIDSQLKDSLRNTDGSGSFVDQSQLSAIDDAEAAGVGPLLYLHSLQREGDTLLVPPPEEVVTRVRETLNRLRARSSSAVFTTTIVELQSELGEQLENPNWLQVVLKEMQRLNQVMLSDGNIYII